MRFTSSRYRTRRSVLFTFDLNVNFMEMVIVCFIAITFLLLCVEMNEIIQLDRFLTIILLNGSSCKHLECMIVVEENVFATFRIPRRNFHRNVLDSCGTI